jgi:hypothetical protein
VTTTASLCWRFSRFKLLHRAIRKNEEGDPPTAVRLLFVKAALAQVKSGGSCGAPCLPPAAALLWIWVQEDRNVFFGFLWVVLQGFNI